MIEELQKLDYKIIIGVVAALVALLSAFIAGIVTIFVSNKTNTVAISNSAIEFLTKKVSILEEYRNKLVSSTPIDRDVDNMSNLANFLQAQYDSSANVISNIDHYITDKNINKLQLKSELIGKALAFRQTKKMGLIPDDVVGKGDAESMTAEKLFEEMQSFSEGVKKMINEELKLATLRVHQLLEENI